MAHQVLVLHNFRHLFLALAERDAPFKILRPHAADKRPVVRHVFEWSNVLVESGRRRSDHRERGAAGTVTAADEFELGFILDSIFRKIFMDLLVATVLADRTGPDVSHR